MERKTQQARRDKEMRRKQTEAKIRALEECHRQEQEMIEEEEAREGQGLEFTVGGCGLGEEDSNSRVEAWVRGESGERAGPTLPEKVVTSTTRKTKEGARERQVDFAGADAREEIVIDDGGSEVNGGDEAARAMESLEELAGAFKAPPAAPPSRRRGAGSAEESLFRSGSQNSTPGAKGGMRKKQERPEPKTSPKAPRKEPQEKVGNAGKPSTIPKTKNLLGQRKLEKKTLTTALPVQRKSRGLDSIPPAMAAPVKPSSTELEAQKKVEALQRMLEDAARKKDALEWELAEEKANNAKLARDARKASEEAVKARQGKLREAERMREPEQAPQMAPETDPRPAN